MAPIDSNEVAQQLTRIHTLQGKGVLTPAEAEAERDAILERVAAGRTNQSFLDFVEPFAEVVESGALSAALFAELKRLHATISKTTPKPEEVGAASRLVATSPGRPAPRGVEFGSTPEGTGWYSDGVVDPLKFVWAALVVFIFLPFCHGFLGC